MPIQSRPELQALQVISSLIVAVAFILGCSLIKEPGRGHFNAIMIAGAGAAYLNGGLGIWEFAFTPIVTVCAYKGLDNSRFIGVGWVLHTIWDVVHHLYGTPIVPFVPASSAECAICDLGIALWCFAGAPSAYELWFIRMKRAPVEDPAEWRDDGGGTRGPSSRPQTLTPFPLLCCRAAPIAWARA
ncbi:MAG: hypothetical protein JO034_05825 [Singulisphaera sp.]|nr:hypothetical protein [Singulisphaera sp.]